jgi:hypothetical protein
LSDLGFRGSNSADASAYKKAGHANEAAFGLLIGGTNVGLPPQGKTDWKSDEGLTFSVKRGFSSLENRWAKHWQVFLYGLNRLKIDDGFINLGAIGSLLRKSLESFPESYERYDWDKSAVKAELGKMPTTVRGQARVDALRVRVEQGNEYISSKDRLAKVNLELVALLAIPENLEAFLEKALFNGTEVQYLAIENGTNFDIFPRELVIKVLSAHLKPELSRAGNRLTDLNIAGQKVVMKCKTNIVEIEVRNEKNHYRELRFNMSAKSAHKLLVSYSVVGKSETRLRWFASRLD